MPRIQQMDDVQQQMVDRYSKMLSFCENLWENIQQEDRNPAFARLDKKIPTLDKMISDMVDQDKQIDQLITEVQGSPKGGEQLSTVEPTNEASAELIEIKERLQKIRDALRKQFGEFLEKKAFLLRLAQTDQAALRLVLDLMLDMAREAAEAVGMDSPTVLGVDDDGEACRIKLGVEDGEDRLTVLIDWHKIINDHFFNNSINTKTNLVQPFSVGDLSPEDLLDNLWELCQCGKRR